jgi:preprotein translocase subunit SecF
MGMELFREVHIDWMGKAKYFIALSLSLLLAGGISWYRKGGLRYGVDFRGGTLVYVRFAAEPPIDKIRQGLASQGLGDSVIQEIKDVTRPASNEVVIGLEQKGQGEEALDTGKAAILQALHGTFGGGAADKPAPATPLRASEAGKPDLNAATLTALTEFLIRRDPLALGSAGNDRYAGLAHDLLSYRDTQRGGLITSLDELKKVQGANDAVIAVLRRDFSLGTFAIRNVEIVGPKVGAQLRRQAILATLYALGGMLLYIAFRFEWVYGAAAVIAVFHDVLITLGFFSLLNYEISLTVIAALLTLVGYSMNDTIVIFDRVRENLRLMRREPLAPIVNRSINQTLSRTILTSGLTFLTVVVLYAMGGQVLRAFSFAMVVGIVIGTYSSFGIAAPIVVAWNKWRGQGALGTTVAGAGAQPRESAQPRSAPAR